MITLLRMRLRQLTRQSRFAAAVHLSETDHENKADWSHDSRAAEKKELKNRFLAGSRRASRRAFPG